jgi:hypothetical protein
MPFKHLLADYSFGAQALAVIVEAYDTALRVLQISLKDQEAKDRLAKLILDIAAEEKELDVADLLEKAMVVWKWESPEPDRQAQPGPRRRRHGSYHGLRF